MGSNSSSSNRTESSNHDGFNSSFVGKKSRNLGKTGSSSNTQIAFTREKILQLYRNHKVTYFKVYESPIKGSSLSSSASSQSTENSSDSWGSRIVNTAARTFNLQNDLKHWEIIVQINDCLYWLISFCEQGQQNLIFAQEDKAINSRPGNTFQRNILIRYGLKVKEIIEAIEEVKDKKYNVGQWNCQLFVNHIVNKVKANP